METELEITDRIIKEIQKEIWRIRKDHIKVKVKGKADGRVFPWRKGMQDCTELIEKVLVKLERECQ